MAMMWQIVCTLPKNIITKLQLKQTATIVRKMLSMQICAVGFEVRSALKFGE
jgi:hypothetical protein